MDEVDWLIGSDEELPVSALEEFYLAGFDPEDDDYDSRRESYEESLNEVVRALLGNAISSKADYRALCQWSAKKIGQPMSSITQLEAKFNTNIQGQLTYIVITGCTPKGEFKLEASIYE